MLEERDIKLQELHLISQSCKSQVDRLMQDNKELKTENKDLKEECDRLEQSYHEIIDEFSKMSSIQ